MAAGPFSRGAAPRRLRTSGFTLIEVMITIAIVAILASIAVPSYIDYIRRGQIQEAFGFLSDFRTKMEQYYQDNRNYGTAATACASDPTANGWNNFAPSSAKYFTFGCKADTAAGDSTQQSYIITATGSAGRAIGHVYTINQSGDRGTTMFKGATVNVTCWLSKDPTC
ncbi:type IV pilin protein [Variovorax sp. SRS16]|uniref:type IV pilin protein n=1 Tax=Variovorax sp. SRS16 TaxID=282217 RepID=UPI0013A534EB|nr:type IV pilin protein [Variovorax sp. SRS16]